MTTRLEAVSKETRQFFKFVPCALLPQSHTVQYDVVGNPRMDFRFSVAFPFHPATATTPAQVLGGYRQQHTGTATWHRGHA